MLSFRKVGNDSVFSTFLNINKDCQKLIRSCGIFFSVELSGADVFVI